MRNDCREWNGYRTEAGYGRMCRNGRMVRVHRYVWELANGPIPEGMYVCHTCDNPPCFLLAHLWLGTHAENQADKMAKGRRGAAGRRPSATCKQGHPIEVANGKRQCLVCARAKQAERQRRAKGNR